MAVGAIFTLYRVCSLWVANIIGNIRFRPQLTPPAVPAALPHPSKLKLPCPPSRFLSRLLGSPLQRPRFTPATSPARE